jgi:hypothetical protein
MLQDSATANANGSRRTGRKLVDALNLAIQAKDRGEPASEAGRSLARQLESVALRPDAVGLQARQVRSAYDAFYTARNKGEQAPPPQLQLGADFADFDLDSSAYENARRVDLLGRTRQPSYHGPDGGLYVDAGGVPTRIPVERYAQFKDQLVRAYRGETPSTGLPITSISTMSKAADVALRAGEWALGEGSWEDTTPFFNVPTADPDMPFASLPSFAQTTDARWSAADRAEAYALLQNPIELRAMQEVLAQASSEGALDIGIGGHILATAGFLADFGATGGYLKAAGAIAGATALRVTGALGSNIGQTVKAAENVTRIDRARGAATATPFSQGFQTIRDFVGYQVVNDAVHGRIGSASDFAGSALTGAKDGAIMAGAGSLIRMVRSNLMGRLAGSYDPVTNRAMSKLGPLGRAAAGIYHTARGADPKLGQKLGVDEMTKRVAALSSQGRGIREMLARQGWSQHAAQMVENTMDSAALGIMFGAYHNATASPGYDDLHPWEKTKRMVDGLTSPEAIGGAVAFAGHVLATGYANKFKWGKEWEKAPPAMREQFDKELEFYTREIAQPSNWENVEAFRKAFDEYRKASPKEWAAYKEFETPYEREALQAAWEGQADSLIRAPDRREPPNDTPPAGETAFPDPGPLEPAGGAGARPAEIRPEGQAAPAAQPPQGFSQSEWAEALAGEILTNPEAALSRMGVEAPAQPRTRERKPVSGEGPDLMRSIERVAELERIPATELVLAPEEMQYKSGTDPKTGRDPEGALTKLKSRDEWSEISAGTILVYERANGERVVVDGHQRTNAAKRLSQGGEPIELNSFVVRESDGITAGQARALGAILNTRAGTGKALDVAKVIRDLGWTAEQVEQLGVRGAFAKQAVGLSQLADPVFAQVVNEQLPANLAAEIGRFIPRADEARQLAAAQMIQRTAKNVEMAESIARGAATEEVFAGRQTDLFGGSDVKTMLELRTEITSDIRPQLKRLATAMKSLARNAETARERKVGEIDAQQARTLAEDQNALIAAIEMQAGKRGTTINELLNRHAEELGKLPDERKRIAESALRELELLAQQGRLFDDSGAGPSQPAQQQSGPSLFSDPTYDYNRGQQRARFPETREPVEPLTPEVEKSWLGKLQGALFPQSEYRNDRVKTLVEQLVTRAGLSSKEAEMVVQAMEARAEVWAKSNGKTIDQWYETRIAGIVNSPTPMPAPEGARAAVTFLSDGRAVLHALSKPRVSDIVHELAHIWRRDLEGAHKAAVEKWAGVRDGVWTRSAEEKWAGAAERWFRQGRAPAPGLAPVFKQMGEWMRSIYRRIRGTGLDVEIPADVRKALESLFSAGPIKEDAAVQARLARLGPAERGAIYVANRNKPQYVGLPQDTIVAHELRGGLPAPARITPAIKIAQAGDSIRQAYDVMRWHSALENVPYNHPDTFHALIELAKGGEAYRAHFEARGSLDALTLAVESARRAKAQTRDAIMASLPEGKIRERMPLSFEYLDAREGTKPVPPELIKKMQATGLADAKGRLNRFVMSALTHHAQNEMALRALEHIGAPQLNEPQAAALPHLAFNRSPWEFLETALARAVSLDRVMDKLREKKWISPEMNRAITRIGSFYGQMWSGNAAGRIHNATIQSAAMRVFGSREQFSDMLRGRGEDALAKLSERFGFRAPPAADMKLLQWAIESGRFAKMKGPQDFERYRKGSGYLFDLARDINDIMGRLGQAAARFGYLDPKQIEKHGGRYVPHLYLSLENQDIVKELREGRMPSLFAGRNMARGSESKDGITQLQIEDPFVWLSTVTHQEAKAIQYLGVLQDLKNGNYAISEAEYRKLDPYSQGVYEPLTLDVVGANPSEASLANGPARANSIVMGNLLKEQLDPASGRPKSTQLTDTLRAYLGLDADMKPSKEGRLYAPRQLVWELDNLTRQMFNAPELETIVDKAMYAYEQATRGFRRGLTIGRPKHWTLNVTNSVMTNHVLDRLPMWDVAKSVLTGKGYFADAQRDIAGLLELVQRRSLETKPADWTNEKWERTQLLQEAFLTLNGTTFTGVGIEASVVTDAMSAAVTPDITTAGALRDLQRSGIPAESQAAWRVAALDMVRRMTGGLTEFDRFLAKLGGSHDANERARAMANFTGFYQLWEMAFKWAATLRTIDTQPEATSLDQAVRYAAVGTADYANTSPLMRSFNSSYSSFSTPLFKEAEGDGGRWARALMRESLKGQFWMYTSTMTGPLMSSVVVHPLRAASAMAVMSAVAGMLHRITTQDPEEDASFQEALRGSVARSGTPIVDAATLEAYSRLGAPWPNVTGGAMIPHEARKGLAFVYQSMLAGKSLIFQAPARGDETRVSSLDELAPGWGNWIGAAQGLQSAASKSPDQIATSMFDAMSLRSGELSIAMAHAAFGGLKLLTSDDPEAWINSLKPVRDAASDVLPGISPFYLASRDGQRLIEVAALDGQKIEEWARGIVQANQPRPAQDLGEFLFSTLWRSQRLVQPHMGGVSEREALDAIVGRLFPESARSDGPFWDKLRSAQSDVHYQMSEVLSGAYDSWLRGGRSMASFDSWLLPQMFSKDGPMQSLLRREPDPEKRARMNEYFQRFVGSDEWSNLSGMAMDLARKRAMTPDFFRQALTNAMRDPTGQAMLNWLDKEVVRSTPSREDIHDYAAIFFGAVRRPGFGTARYQQWEQVLRRLYDYGYKPAVLYDDAAEALRRRGIKPEISGAPALQSALITRPPR